MKKVLFTAIAVVSLGSTAQATDVAHGGFGAHVGSVSVSGGAAVTGGIGAFGTKGSTTVINRQGAANVAGASATLKFKDHYLGRPGDGITVNLDLDTFSVSEQMSQTRVRDTGVGTAGVGIGGAKSGGLAKATGGFGGFGFHSW